MTVRTPAQYDWTLALFNDRRLSKNFTSPRRGKITHVTLHHMTIVAPADDPTSTVAVEGAYDTWMGGRAASANYGVSGELVWQYVSDNDAAWSDANSTSNNSTLSIEHANSTAGPTWQISDQTMATGARLVATLHRLYGLGRPSRKTVRMHRDYYATACPGPYMVDHLNDYIAAAGRWYDGETPEPAPTPEPTAQTAVWDLPSTWKVGAVGPAVTKLGQRLVIHAAALGLPEPYKVGPGPEFTETDRAAVAAFQKAQGWTGADADGYPGPETFRRLAAEPKSSTTYTIATWNLKSPTLIGKWLTWPLRRGGQRDIIKAIRPDVLLAQEVGPPSKEAWYNTALGAIGLTNAETHNAAGSGKWRAIWFNPKAFTRVTAGLYTIGPRQGTDDKQMGETVLTDDNGDNWYFGSLHLENEDGAKNDRVRVDQIDDCFRRATARAGLHDVAPEHVVLGGDTNSQNMVRQWVHEHTDYRDAAGLAKTATNTGIRSINGWRPFRSGAREDYLFVHKDAAVQTFTQVDGHKVSDHNPQIITITA